MEDDRLMRLLRGDYNDLPPHESTVVRIFLSSTFGDFIHERNKLMQDVFPPLQRYCQSHGLELQVVDMRWGVRDESISYHQTSEVCLKEVELCKQLSIGPTFIAFLGNRYGYRPVPAHICVEDFNILQQAGSNATDTSLLSDWYKVDSNAVPPVYQLQPITGKFPNYTSKDEKLRAKDRDGWWQTFQKLQNVLWKLAIKAQEDGHMSAEQSHYYQMSVTEDELIHGLLNNQFPNDHCLCYNRNLVGLNDNLLDNLAEKHCDIISTSSGHLVLDNDAQELLRNLKNVKIPQKLQAANLHTYEVPWKPGGIDPLTTEHASYLDIVSKQVHHDLITLIDQALDRRKVTSGSIGSLQKEVRHHASFSITKCESFCGRVDTMASIKRFIQSNIRKPLVVYGISGIGKTSVMAMVVKQAHNWLGNDAVCIIRFLGTTPSSTTIREVLTSICHQLSLVYGLQVPDMSGMDFNEVSQFFQSLLLDTLPPKLSANLVILLDSIDQLSSTDGAHSMTWLPRFLPPGIHVVVSMLPTEHNCLATMKSLLPFENCYLEVSAMQADTGFELFTTWLSRVNRTVTEEQMKKVMAAFSNYSQPLFLRLLFHQAIQWKSYTSTAQKRLPQSTTEALVEIFRDIEEHHGDILVRRAFGYLTGCRNGITEAELEDVLSLDNEVLSDVYQYWDPPVEGVIRIPPLLWKRIRHEVSDYLVERQANGKTVLAWYHRQFIECALHRYLSGSSKHACHYNLASYFEGSWSMVPKPVHLIHRQIKLENVSRQVAPQPLQFSEQVYNLRKLNELPVHLIESNQNEKLKQLVLCNYLWLFTKLRATSFINVMLDFGEARKQLDDKDIELVSEALALSAHNLKVNPNALASQLVGRLIGYSSSTIGQLLSSAKTWSHTSKDCQLLPINNCLISPGGPLKITLSGHKRLVEYVAVCEPLSLVVSVSKDAEMAVINIWDLKSVEYAQNTHSVKITGQGKPCIALNGRLVIGSCDASIKIWDMVTGDNTCSETAPSQVTCLASSVDPCSLVFAGLENGGILTLDACNGILHCFQLAGCLPVSAILATSNSQCNVVSGHKDGTVNSFKVNSSGVIHLHHFIGHTKNVTCIFECSHPADKSQQKVATCSEDSTIHILDLHFGSLLQVLSGHKKAVKCLESFVNGNTFYLVSGSLDNTVKVWDLDSYTCVQTLEGHTNAVWCLSILHKEKLIVSGSKDDYIKVWSIATGECIQTLVGHSSWISSVAVLQLKSLIISGCNDKTLKVWDFKLSNEASMQRDRHNCHPHCIAGIQTTSGKGLVVSGGADATKVWCASSGACIHSIQQPSSALCIWQQQDKLLLVTGNSNGCLSVKDLTSFEEVYTTKAHTEAITQLLCAGELVISASADSKVKVWNIHTGKLQYMLQGHTKDITCIALSSDSTLLATGSVDCSSWVWSLVAKEHRVCSLIGHQKTVCCIAITSDNSLVTSGSDDNTLRIWSIPSGSCLHTLAYTDSVKCLVCTSDSLQVVAGAHCGVRQLKAWSTATGHDCITYTGHTHAVMCMLLSRDERFLITGSRDGTVKVWNMTNSEKTVAPLTSFDLQSQVRHISIIEDSSDEAILTATTKSGPIAILKLFLRMK